MLDAVPIKAGAHRTGAIKVVDDRGLESLKVIHLD